MPKPELSILVPCYNESGNLQTLIDRTEKALQGIGATFEVVLVDDGSTDNTFEVMIKLGERSGRVVAVKHDTNMGISEGWASALEASGGKYVLTTDADLQYRPEDIPSLWKEMVAQDVDLVQGWRASNPGGSRLRRIFSRFFSMMLNFIFRTGLKDIKSGFILYKREAFENILMDRKHFRYFQHFPTIAARARGYSIRQAPVVFDRRHSGESFIKNSILFGVKSLVDLPKAMRMYRKGRS